MPGGGRTMYYGFKAGLIALFCCLVAEKETLPWKWLEQGGRTHGPRRDGHTAPGAQTTLGWATLSPGGAKPLNH